MALSYIESLRDARLQAVITAIDQGASAGKLRIYNAPRPDVEDPITTQTLLAELTMDDPSGTVSAGVLTFDPITTDATADNTGTAAWFRIVDSDGDTVVDGSVGTSGADLNLNTTSIVAGQSVAVVSASITAGNP